MGVVSTFYARFCRLELCAESGRRQEGRCVHEWGREGFFARRGLGRMRAYRLERSDDDDGAGVGDDPVATTEVRQLRQAVGGP